MTTIPTPVIFSATGTTRNSFNRSTFPTDLQQLRQGRVCRQGKQNPFYQTPNPAFFSFNARYIPVTTPISTSISLTDINLCTKATSKLLAPVGGAGLFPIAPRPLTMKQQRRELSTFVFSSHNRHHRELTCL